MKHGPDWIPLDKAANMKPFFDNLFSDLEDNETKEEIAESYGKQIRDDLSEVAAAITDLNPRRALSLIEGLQKQF